MKNPRENPSFQTPIELWNCSKNITIVLIHLRINHWKMPSIEWSKCSKVDFFKRCSVKIDGSIGLASEWFFCFSRIDIQEFYESILLDEQSDRLAKMNATLHLAEEWEKQPMLKREIRVEFRCVLLKNDLLQLFRTEHQRLNLHRQSFVQWRWKKIVNVKQLQHLFKRWFKTMSIQQRIIVRIHLRWILPLIWPNSITMIIGKRSKSIWIA